MSLSLLFVTYHIFRYQARNGSVTPDDLWAAFEEQIHDKDVLLPQGMTITSIMKSWTENRGYPLIKVRRIANGKMVNIIIEQVSMSDQLPYTTAQKIMGRNGI